MAIAASLNPAAALTAAERRLLGTLGRLDEGQSLVLDDETDIRVAHGLRSNGIVQGQNDDDDGFRLTTIGRAFADGL